MLMMKEEQLTDPSGLYFGYIYYIDNPGFDSKQELTRQG